ncbi:transketolase [Candidatus Amesbacteria bacterium RIFCSPHIGHO2_02_FULL_48_21]|uniref:Transketolase n=3 Tax=Candidatus Amesiibacteriota TaxID=1752730 RepID=A0A1F4ZDH7_9BACT|nr:MAG: Transketolase domain protein [Candidatus Amesbacteria bacterium GW2011_GWA2_47_11]KKU99412.1 MAG: Transketolase domain protein [Candidatus Amesbacteria bacterium GW2011_GWA1_48_9]OGC89412.1 MAG: transketolase [Candidatus Amesbacteria bacterium RBG_19FT_COMBO_48_16]OGC95709.1 MAG: transketolase [Candidatus Amesbacteria bacterium RIFCSPHIGHO2_02_FULL_48_21]OGC99140.1 MAG: transketolase [Candidatus Amesbacteria bacterium RBG_16_48_31]OGC99641.1 MAG: transketolase [Candidatus Amesbacteria 
MSLTDEQVRNLELKAIEIRKDIIKMLLSAGSGHSAGPLGMADVFCALYFSGVLNWDPVDPWKPDRDRVILSNGHICPVWYATLAHTGAFSHRELLTLRKLGSPLQGHPHYRELPGVENTGGPLGQGLSQAVGQALAARMDEARWRVYCLMSDAEEQEGQTWEAVMFAGNNNLFNLTAIVDRNNIQIDGYTEEVMPLEPLADKWRAFNWTVLEADGHNIREVAEALEKAKTIRENPTVVIAHTIPGKGVEFMEGDFAWHGKPPKPEEGAKALKQLRTLWGNIKSEHE